MPSVMLDARATSTRTLEISLATLLALTIVLTFWGQQRYPALLKKLHAGTSLHVAGNLSFDALLPVTPAMPAPLRVARTSVNWIYTNRFGMYFALPFGAALMTLMANLTTPRRFGSAAGNVLCGAIVGAPLGVCTNCATPVGQSLLAGGASTRLTVAAMISSPSFNPVVVAMAFVLFPLPVAALRLIVPLGLLLALPLLVSENKPRLRTISVPPPLQPVGKRVTAFAQTYLRNLFRLTWLTLPWMLLAAVLGALAAELIPAYGTRLPVSTLGIIAVALLGTLLPVPMALDVALAFILFHAGVPLPYVVALLCTLGPVSIYSLTALGSQLDRRVSLRLASATTAFGSLAGLLVHVGVHP